MASDAGLPLVEPQSPHQPQSASSATTPAATTASTAQATSTANLPASVVTPATAATDAKPNLAAPWQSPVSAPLQATPGATSLKTTPRSIRVQAIIGGVTQQSEVALPANGTIGQALKAMGVVLGRYDRMTPLSTKPAYDGITVRVTRVQVVDQSKRRQTIQPILRYKPTTAIKRGAQKLLQKGQPGIVEISERQWIIDGKPGRRQTNRRVIQTLKDKIIGLGARSVYIPGKTPYHRRYARAYSLSARGGSPRDRMMGGASAVRGTSDSLALRPVRSITIKTSAYVVGHCGSPYMRTATGLPATYGAVAVDPRFIPLGTKMYIEGYGYAFACDTGGAIKGNRVDLAMDSLRAAFRHGRRTQRAWILAP